MSDSLAFSFDHVHLFCTDLATMERWFVSGLGAEVLRRRVVKGAPAADLLLAGTKIFIRQAQTGETLGPAGPSRYGTDHFGLRVENLDAAAAELKRRGVEFEMEPQDAGPGLRISFIKGPDSIRIEVVQRD